VDPSQEVTDMKFLKWISGFMLLVLVGCASYSGDNGVENRWRSGSTPEWEVGVTTEQDVAEHLGPPSQLINLDDQVVYYYLREHRRGKGLILILFNWGYQKLTYDRAVFFYDKEGLLTKYSYSPEALPYDDAVQ
jgi:hypothetical protein